MKKITKVIAVLLIMCMCSTCVFAEELPSNESEQNDIGSNTIQSEAEATRLLEAPSAGSLEYIENLKLIKSEVTGADAVSMTFSWEKIAAAVTPYGYDVVIYSDKDMTQSVDTEEIEDGDVASVKINNLQKGTRYYISVKPYVNDGDDKAYGKAIEGMGIYLDKPVIKNISDSGTAVSLNFNSVKGATHYVVRNDTVGNEIEVGAERNTIEISELIKNAKDSFKIKAIYKDNENDFSSDWSDPKSIVINAPSKPALKSEPYDRGIILSWNKVSGATSYEIWRYYNKKWSKIKTTSSTSFKNTGLTVGKQYYYKVRAIRTVSGNTVTGAFSDTKSISARRYLTGDIRMGYSAGRLWQSAKKYKEGSSTKLISKTKIKRGTKVTILKRTRVNGKSMAYVRLSNGQKYWIRSGNISYGAPYTTLDYTTETKERFVNNKGYSSKTKYLLFISTYTQKTYIFTGKKGNWKLYRTCKCVTGKASTRTPRGVFKIYKKAKRGWCYKYVSYFNSRNSFHTRPYGTKVMGKPASNGCIRLYNKDAEFIYKYVPKGTTVVSY